MNPTPSRSSTRSRFARGLYLRVALAGLAASLLAAHAAHGQAITVPNYDFSSPNASGYPFETAPGAPTSWTQTVDPGYSVYEQETGTQWYQTVGAFANTSPYITNLDANQQAGYIFSLPGDGLYQDLTAAQFTAGPAYTMWVGLIGGTTYPMNAGDTIDLILYYRDINNNMITLGDTTVTYGSDPGDLQPESGDTNYLQYFNVAIGAVQAGDPEVGQNIGIEVLATGGQGESYFDVGNVSVAPEPATAGLLMFGIGALVVRRRRPVC